MADLEGEADRHARDERWVAGGRRYLARPLQVGTGRDEIAELAAGETGDPPQLGRDAVDERPLGEADV